MDTNMDTLFPWPTIQLKNRRSGRVSKPPQSNELPENFHMLSPRERFLKDHRQSYFHEYYLWQMNPALFAKYHKSLGFTHHNYVVVNKTHERPPSTSDWIRGTHFWLTDSEAIYHSDYKPPSDVEVELELEQHANNNGNDAPDLSVVVPVNQLVGTKAAKTTKSFQAKVDILESHEKQFFGKVRTGALEPRIDAANKAMQQFNELAQM